MSRSLFTAHHLLTAVYCFLITAFLASCSAIPQKEIAGSVNLNNLQPLPTPEGHTEVPLRVAVGAIVSPKGTIESYSPLLDYLSKKLNRPVELVQRRTYLEVNGLVERGEVDIAFVCSGPYVEGHDSFGMELLAAPQVNGKTTYNSLLIVPAASQAKSITDLRGKVFVFTDPISLTGRLYPAYLVQQIGATPETFFSRTFFTYSHDEAIRAVASGLADGAAVDSMVYEYTLTSDPSLAEKVKVIQRSPDFGIPPVVVSPLIRPQIRAELQTLLLDMASDPDAKNALASIGVERFVTIKDSAYDSVRSLVNAAPSSMMQP